MYAVTTPSVKAEFTGMNAVAPVVFVLLMKPWRAWLTLAAPASCRKVVKLPASVRTWVTLGA